MSDGDLDCTVRPLCPRCGSTETIVRVWGMPTLELFEFAQTADWLHLEGCVWLADQWDLACDECGYRRYPSDGEDSHNAEDLDVPVVDG